MCAKGCSDNEECRYDKENCEYKCLNPYLIWAPIVAVAGTVIIGLLIFFVVRYFKNKAQMKNTINKENSQIMKCHKAIFSGTPPPMELQKNF